MAEGFRKDWDGPAEVQATKLGYYSDRRWYPAGKNHPTSDTFVIKNFRKDFACAELIQDDEGAILVDVVPGGGGWMRLIRQLPKQRAVRTIEENPGDAMDAVREAANAAKVKVQSGRKGAPVVSAPAQVEEQTAQKLSNEPKPVIVEVGSATEKPAEQDVI